MIRNEMEEIYYDGIWIKTVTVSPIFVKMPSIYPNTFNTDNVYESNFFSPKVLFNKYQNIGH